VATITVQLQGLDQLKRKLKPKLYEKAVANLMEDMAIIGERTAKQRAPRDTGALKRSIHSAVKPTSARVFSNLNYAVPVEYGRGRGKRMPPPNALHGWLRRHGIPVSAAYVVARAIGRRGIKGRFFMKAAVDAINMKTPFLIKVASGAIAKKWSR
jgi:hypothetical protein